jgi:hypothetical protein
MSSRLLQMKFPYGVILDETVPDQVRFHRVISVGIKVLAALTRIDGDFFLECQTMPFGNGNKLSHVLGKLGPPSMSCTSIPCP